MAATDDQMMEVVDKVPDVEKQSEIDNQVIP